MVLAMSKYRETTIDLIDSSTYNTMKSNEHFAIHGYLVRIGLVHLLTTIENGETNGTIVRNSISFEDNVLVYSLFDNIQDRDYNSTMIYDINTHCVLDMFFQECWIALDLQSRDFAITMPDPNYIYHGYFCSVEKVTDCSTSVIMDLIKEAPCISIKPGKWQCMFPRQVLS